MTTPTPPLSTNPNVMIEHIQLLQANDLQDLCDITEAAILDGGGFGWTKIPVRQKLENYWKGVVLVPERLLFIGRLDGVIAASSQLHRPPPNNEAQSFVATITGSFVAPWARGHGLGRGLIKTIETQAKQEGFSYLKLDVRATQTAAIALFESLGYTKWGINPEYAYVDGHMIAGYYYQKRL